MSSLLKADSKDEIQKSESKEVKKDDMFFFSLITFKVEDCLFRVPRLAFEKESDVFKGMFLLPRGEIADSEVDGSSEEKPLVLEGVKAEDFRCLMRVLFPLPRSPYWTAFYMTSAQWISVLRLSHMWCFNGIRLLAIAELEKDAFLGVTKKVELAYSFDISSWIRPACHALAMRRDSLSLEEGIRLGMDFVIKLGLVRDIRYRWQIENRGSAQLNRQPAPPVLRSSPIGPIPISNPTGLLKTDNPKESLEKVVNDALTDIFGLEDGK